MKKRRALFVSDLHLSDDQPHITRQFQDFLRDIAKGSDQLYILGDLFDYWIGDDHKDNRMAWSIADLLNDVSITGTKIYFIHGNRDFLIGEDFATRAGLKILQDETKIHLYGQCLLLMHGDTLCTDDIEYLKFRTLVRDSAWQKNFLSKDLTERQHFAWSAREVSSKNKSQKKTKIMDVNGIEVKKIIGKHSPCQLIHGHTHKPAHHKHEINGEVFNRFVLPDWDTGGGYLMCDQTGCELKWLKPYTKFKSN